jgi:cytochrome c553
MAALALLSTAATAGEDLMQRPPWAACAYCHGEDGRIDSTQVPAIAGQSADYIRKQLSDFRAGRRQSLDGQMRSATMLLDPADDARVGAYFAALAPARTTTPPVSVDQSRTGAQWFWYGGGQVPACASCHASGPGGGPTRADAPRLFGLNAGYLARQLRAFRAGSRDNDRDAVMRTVAASLDDRLIVKLVNYLAVGDASDGPPGSSP